MEPCRAEKAQKSKCILTVDDNSILERSDISTIEFLRNIMEDSSNDNGKISDSGYSNVYVSQSQIRSSSDSSMAQKNTNRSDSGRYSGGTPLVSDSCNYVLPQSTKMRKEKGHKKTKSKASMAVVSTGNADTQPGSQINPGKQNDVGAHGSNESASDSATNRKKREEIGDVEMADDTELEENNGDTNSTELERGIDMITNPVEDTTSNINATFGVVISMENGLIVEVTPSLSAILGYKRESWINCSFIEFVHSKDKQTFADHLAKNIVLTYSDRDKGFDGQPTSIFCSLRENKEQRSRVGSASDESSSCVVTSNSYVPFHLVTSIKVFSEFTSTDKVQMMFLIIKAERVMPIYKVPEEMMLSTMFSTRHDCNCILSHVEVDVVQCFGYMPQDMIGRSVFDYYHSDDLLFLKGVYEIIVKTGGSPFRSAPYRFATQNGDYVVLETEWSAFFNPWSEKIEFVIGLHRVLRGPTNPNVFQTPSDCQTRLLANVSKKSEIIQGEIRAILNEVQQYGANNISIHTSLCFLSSFVRNTSTMIQKTQRTGNNDTCEMASSSKNLEAFMKNLLRMVMPPAPVSKEPSQTEDKSFLKLDTTIKGAKSPHLGYCDSKSYTETPASYSQLNYIDKITRYFDSSLPMNGTYESEDGNMNPNVPSNKNDSKPGSNVTGTKQTMHSGGNLSSESNNRMSCDSRDDSDNSHSANLTTTGGLKIPALTESALSKHTQEMENLLIRQHKERRSKNNNSKENKDSRANGTKDKPNNKRPNDQKRSCDAKKRKIEDREEEQCKIPKGDESVRPDIVAPEVATTTAPVNSKSILTPETAPTQNSNVWTPVTAPILPRSHFYTAAPSNERPTESHRPEPSPSVLVYCVPLPQIHNHLVPAVIPINDHYTSPFPQVTHVPYVPAALTGVIYPPMVCAPEPVSTMYEQFLLPRPAPIHRETPQTRLANARREDLSECIERPASQATSIKGELGSTMALSEDSKKILFLGEQLPSCISIDGACSSLVPNTKRETNTNSQFDSSLEDSSDSSFYGSFLTKSNGSSYDRNEKIVAQHPQNTPLNCMDHNKKQIELLPRGLPWQESEKLSDQMIYQYQLTPKPLNEVLKADMKFLEKINQPSMVSDQLVQMYSDMRMSEYIRMTREHDVSMDIESSTSGDKQRNIQLELNNTKEGHEQRNDDDYHK